VISPVQYVVQLGTFPPVPFPALEISRLAPTTQEEPVVQPELIKAALPDFASIQSVAEKKQQFFDYVQDYVIAENEKIVAVRKQLDAYAKTLGSGAALSQGERKRMLELALSYDVETELNSDQKIIDELLLRVDMIPVSLVLAQAANESGWGTSRFAVQGNNLFGHWCYREGCGIVPAQRTDDAKHEVRSFPTIKGSVNAYFANINSHHLYQDFREIRAEMREQQMALDPMALASGLQRYSERGLKYVEDIVSIIVQNNLEKRDQG
jgi:Bax protein